MNEAILFVAIACTGMLVQSFLGFAGSPVAVPLFALWLDPREAVPAYTLLMVVIDVGLVLHAPKHVQWRTVVKFGLSGIVGVQIGKCLHDLLWHYAI